MARPPPLVFPAPSVIEQKDFNFIGYFGTYTIEVFYRADGRKGLTVELPGFGRQIVMTLYDMNLNEFILNYVTNQEQFEFNEDPRRPMPGITETFNAIGIVQNKPVAQGGKRRSKKSRKVRKHRGRKNYRTLRR